MSLADCYDGCLCGGYDPRECCDDTNKGPREINLNINGVAPQPVGSPPACPDADCNTVDGDYTLTYDVGSSGGGYSYWTWSGTLACFNGTIEFILSCVGPGDNPPPDWQLIITNDDAAYEVFNKQGNFVPDASCSTTNEVWCEQACWDGNQVQFTGSFGGFGYCLFASGSVTYTATPSW